MAGSVMDQFVGILFTGQEGRGALVGVLVAVGVGPVRAMAVSDGWLFMPVTPRGVHPTNSKA
jgi:hypothetical protein